MGKLTRTQIVTRGLLKAGRSDLTTRATEALEAWLRARYKDWPFPFLKQSREGLSLPAGTTSLKVGAGEGGITNEVQRILNPIIIYTSNYGTYSKALATPDGDTSADIRGRNPTTFRGLPTSFKVRTALSASALVCKQLIFSPIPDKAYLLSFDYIDLPDPIPNANSIPLYPNDQTMINFVEMFALNWANGKDDAAYQRAEAEVGDQVMRDRIHDGMDLGTNDSIPLDPGVYR